MAKQISELRKMQRSQLSKINKDDLIESILKSREEEGVANITKILLDVKADVDSLKTLVTSPDSTVNKKIAALEVKVDKQAEIISRQQLYLEVLDRKEREANLVILGVPDEHEALDGAVTDDDKLEKIWEKVGVNNVAGTHRRLGRSDGDGSARRCRPILLMLQDKTLRTHILDQAKNLKSSGDAFKKIYVKKDVHPAVRKEWQRLRDVEKAERERPENAGCVIYLNARERKLYRDGDIIDSWNPQVFLITHSE